MRRRAPGETVERLRLDRVQSELHDLARRCARWAADHVLTGAEPDMPDLSSDRARDNWRPLLALADAAGGDWPARARRSASLLSGGPDADSIKVQLLVDVRSIFTTKATERVGSGELCEALAALEERPWSEWGRREKPISPKQLAGLLGPFGVSSRSVRLADGTIPKGYHLQDFTDAFTRYIPPSETPHRHNPGGSGANGQTDAFLDPPQGGSVAFGEMAQNGRLEPENGICGGVADQEAVQLDEEEFARLEREAIQNERGDV